MDEKSEHIREQFQLRARSINDMKTGRQTNELVIEIFNQKTCLIQ